MSYFVDLDQPDRVIHGPHCVKMVLRRMSKFEKKAVDYYDDKRLIMTCQSTIDFKRAMKCRFSLWPNEYYPAENG